MNVLGSITELLSIPGYHRQLREVGYPRPPWERIRYGPHRRQYALLAQQPDPEAPVCCYYHGGGWQFGSPEVLEAFGAYFYQRGYTVYMPSHRRLFRFGGRSIYHDLLAGLRRLPHRSGTRPQTTRPQVLLAGMSSGAQLATLLALQAQAFEHLIEVRGLLACAGPLSLDELPRTPTRHRFAGRDGSRLDALRLLQTRPEFPALLIHGTQDALVPYACSQVFADRAHRLNWSNLRLVTLPGGTHLDAAAWIFSN